MVSEQTCWTSHKIKIQRPRCSSRWHCKRWFGLLCSIHRARFICVTNDGCRSSGCHSKATRAGQAADAVSADTQVKMEDASSLLNIPKSELSRYLDTSTTTQMGKILVQHGRSSRSSWAKSVRSPSGRTMMGKAIRKSSIGTRLDYSCLCMWTI